MNSTCTKISPRTRKRRFREEMKEQIVAQVHKPVVSSESTEDSAPEGNRTYTKYEDTKNENISVHTPSRDVSVDGETQINSKILSLIETEMKRDINKHSHFTDSRPQSLSFYEDEKVPEELSGNLELLSPEERKHYKKKNYISLDPEEMNAYNTLQDSYMAREAEDIMNSSLKKSKSRKSKRHAADSELGMGDSREMMIPKEKKKSKKKKRETSPAASNNTKRKHKRKDDEEPRNEVTAALEELQDDVFEHDHEDLTIKTDKIRRSPRKTDKLYVQKKNKFEVITKPNAYPNRIVDSEGGNFGKRSSRYPIEVALLFQRYWMRLSTLCHGLLGGLALGHWLYIICNIHQQDYDFLIHYAYYSDIYVGIFYALTVLCLVSMYDRIDLVHLSRDYINELWQQRRSSVVVFLYLGCFLIHLSMTNYDDQLAMLTNEKHMNITNVTTMTNTIQKSDLDVWNNLSLWRAILAFTAWIFIGLGPPGDMLYCHLKTTEAYLPSK